MSDDLDDLHQQTVCQRCGGVARSLGSEDAIVLPQDVRCQYEVPNFVEVFQLVNDGGEVISEVVGQLNGRVIGHVEGHVVAKGHLGLFGWNIAGGPREERFCEVLSDIGGWRD